MYDYGRSASANRPDEVSEAVFEERMRIEKPPTKYQICRANGLLGK